MELVLVRHALPVRQRVEVGAADPGLGEEGRAQAAALARWLAAAQAAEPVDALVSSPAARARETAAPLAAALGLPVAVVDGLAEFDAGAAEYVPVEELRAAGDPRWHALARGEAYGEVDPDAYRRRVVDAAEGLVAAHPGGRVVAVAHAGAINAYVGHVLGLARLMWFAPAYTSVSRVGAARDGRRGVISLNETGHLRA